jgi:Ni/Fe-hydrogenase 1 B-type cytochrome subunit
VDKITVKKEWSLAIRVNHWLMVICIFGLIITGFYIARPFTNLSAETTNVTFNSLIPPSISVDVVAGETVNRFFMGYTRFLHLICGIILTFVFIWRIYLMFFSRFHADFKDFFAWTDTKNFWTQIKFYLLISEKKPEHNYLYGPLQSLAYGGVLLLLLVLVVTGLILAGVDYSGGMIGIMYTLLHPIQKALGGLASVRFIHHIFTWFVILFVVVHIYMAFWYDIVFKEGTISSMVSGRIFRKEHD